MIGFLKRICRRSGHPGPKRLIAFLQRNLGTRQIDRIREHLSSCEECRAMRNELERALRRAEELYLEKTPEPAILFNGRERLLQALAVARPVEKSEVDARLKLAAYEFSFYARACGRRLTENRGNPDSVARERRILEIFLGRQSASGLPS